MSTIPSLQDQLQANRTANGLPTPPSAQMKDEPIYSELYQWGQVQQNRRNNGMDTSIADMNYHPAPPTVQAPSPAPATPSIAPHVDVAQTSHDAANNVMQEAHPQLKEPDQSPSLEAPKPITDANPKEVQRLQHWLDMGLSQEQAENNLRAERGWSGRTNLPAPNSPEYSRLVAQGNMMKKQTHASEEKRLTDAIAAGDADAVSKIYGFQVTKTDKGWNRESGMSLDDKTLHDYAMGQVETRLSKTSPVELATRGNAKYAPSYAAAKKPETWTYHKQDDGSYLATNNRNPNEHHTIDTSVEGTSYHNYGGTLYKQTVKGKNITKMEKAPDEMQPDHNVITSGTVDGKTVKLLVNYGNDGKVKSKTPVDDGKALPPDKEVAVLDKDGKPAWYDPKTHQTRPTDGEVTATHKKLMQNKTGNKIIDGEETLHHGGATFPDPGNPNRPAKIPVSIVTTVDEDGTTVRARQIGEEGKKAINDLGIEYVKQKDAMARQLAAETDPGKKVKIQEAIDYWDKAATRLKQMTDSMNTDEQNKKDENGRHKVTSDEEYNALPSGAEFTGPDGVPRRKP